jgi:hypothetical protein
MHAINVGGEVFADKRAQCYPKESKVCDAEKGEVCEHTGGKEEKYGGDNADGGAASIGGALIPGRGLVPHTGWKNSAE